MNHKKAQLRATAPFFIWIILLQALRLTPQFLGGLLCAERTSEHLQMYREAEEAVFWESAEECATVCLSLLADERRRQAVAEAGRRRVKRNRHYNEAVMDEIVTASLCGS